MIKEIEDGTGADAPSNKIAGEAFEMWCYNGQGKVILEMIRKNENIPEEERQLMKNKLRRAFEAGMASAMPELTERLRHALDRVIMSAFSNV